MDPRRKSDRQLSPAQMKQRFVAMLTGLFVITAGAVGFQIYKSVKKEPKAPPVQQMDPNAIVDANTPINGERE
jgi:hypothetical protein